MSEEQKQKATYNFQKIKLVARKHFLHSVTVIEKSGYSQRDTKTNIYCLLFDIKDRHNPIAKTSDKRDKKIKSRTGKTDEKTLH